eukprot:7197361-Pyramimonas_sp.AAC.1
MVPTATGGGGQASNTIDLSALLSAQAVDDSLFSISLGAEFDNGDGLIEQKDMEELDRRKKG